MIREETCWNRIQSPSHPSLIRGDPWRPGGTARKIKKFQFKFSWRIEMDRVHPHSHRPSPCKDCQHPCYTAVIRQSLSRMLAVCTRWMAARTRMYTVHFNPPWKIKHVKFFWRFPPPPPPRSSRITADHSRITRGSLRMMADANANEHGSISNRQEKLIGDVRNVFKLMDISSA